MRRWWRKSSDNQKRERLLTGIIASVVIVTILAGIVFKVVVPNGLAKSNSGRMAKYLGGEGRQSERVLQLLAASNLATLVLALADSSSRLTKAALASAILIVIVVLAFVYFLAKSRSIASAVIGGVGYGAALLGAALTHGVSMALLVAVISVLLMWFLGLFAKFVP